MAIVKMKAIFQSEIKDVWNVVTSLDNYQWRSDLSKIEVISEKQFMEYTKDGYATHFQLRLRSRLNAGNLIWKTVICEGIGQAFFQFEMGRPKLNLQKM